jgi:AraC-like DNA-binding protein
MAFNKIDDLRELVSQRLINLDFQQIGEGPFQSSVKAILATPDVCAVRWSHSPGQTFRDTGLVRDGDESVSLIYPVNCSITVTHLDREQRLTPGHSIVVRHDKIGRIGAHHNCRYVALVIPQSTQAHARLTSRGLFAERWSDELPALKLLKAYMSLLGARTDLMQGDVAASAGRHIADLIQVAAAELSDRPSEHDRHSIADARLQVALACIEKQFGWHNLSVVSVARAQGISPRYLHKLFERAGIRFTDRVTERRLKAAYQALECSDTPVARVALDSGFSDVSHFNRLFRKRFGATPSAIRSRRRY